MKLNDNEMYIDVCRVYNCSVSEIRSVLEECTYFYFIPEDKRIDSSRQLFEARIVGSRVDYEGLLAEIKKFPGNKTKKSDTDYHIFNFPNDVVVSVSCIDVGTVSILVLPEYSLKESSLSNQTVNVAAVNEHHLACVRRINAILKSREYVFCSKLRGHVIEPLFGTEFLGKAFINSKEEVADYRKVVNWIDGRSYEVCQLKEEERKKSLMKKQSAESIKKDYENKFTTDFESKNETFIQFIGEGIVDLSETYFPKLSKFINKIKTKLKEML